MLCLCYITTCFYGFSNDNYGFNTPQSVCSFLLSLSLSLSLCTFDYKYHFPLTDECPMKIKHHFNLVFGVVPVPHVIEIKFLSQFQMRISIICCSSAISIVVF